MIPPPILREGNFYTVERVALGARNDRRRSWFPPSNGTVRRARARATSRARSWNPPDSRAARQRTRHRMPFPVQRSRLHNEPTSRWGNWRFSCRRAATSRGPSQSPESGSRSHPLRVGFVRPRPGIVASTRKGHPPSGHESGGFDGFFRSGERNDRAHRRWDLLPDFVHESCCHHSLGQRSLHLGGTQGIVLGAFPLGAAAFFIPVGFIALPSTLGRRS